MKLRLWVVLFAALLFTIPALTQDKQLEQTVKKLLLDLNSSKSDLQQAARQTFRALGDKAIPALVKVANDSKSKLRLPAIQALGETSVKAIPHLQKVLNFPQASLRYAAFKSLVQKGKVATPAIIHGLTNSDPTVRHYSRVFLEKMADNIVAELEKGLKHPSPTVKIEVILILEGVSSYSQWDRHLPHLIKSFGPQDKQVLIKMTTIFKRRKAYSSAPVLLKTLRKNNNKLVQQYILSTLLAFGSKIKLTAPPLVHVLQQGEPMTAMAAMDGLVQMGKPAVTHLLPLLQHKKADIRSQTCLTLGRIGPDAAQAVPTLRALLIKDAKFFVQADAAQALGNIGLASQPALPALKYAAQSKNSLVSQAAKKAISKIYRARK